MTVCRLSVSDARFAALAINTLKAPATLVTASTLARFLSRPENILLVADDHGTPAGFLGRGKRNLVEEANQELDAAFVQELLAGGPPVYKTPLRWQ